MKAKIKYLTFQRNGVRGTSFYHCLAEITDDKKRTMLITFETIENDNSSDSEINIPTCRAVYMDDLSEKWRGDEIAYTLQKELNKLMAIKNDTIYGCCTDYIPLTQLSKN